MNPITALTAWRNTRSVEDAIKHHDRTKLAVELTLLLTFAVTMLKGTKYGPLLASFLDPDILGAVGVLVAGLIAKFGHWSTSGALANAAPDVAGASWRSPAGIEEPLAAPPGSRPADAGATPQVRPRSEADREAP